MMVRSTGKSGNRRRPVTAGRKAQLTFGKKLGMNQAPKVSSIAMSAKASSQINFELNKLRPNGVINQDREKLYEDVMKQRMTTNNLATENTRLRTRIQILETEVSRKDKVIDDMAVNQDASNYGMPSLHSGRPSGIGISNIKVETHLVINLKRKIRDMNVQNQKMQE